MISFLYILLAALGLGFLIFIHELAHYWMARRVGMRVEAFSIGFGKALISWTGNGVKWQIGWLPFGGYVKIAGMQKEGDTEPHDIPNGYFSKKPIDRIKVAAIAPIVNIILAFLLFSSIWALGGRDSPFSDHTNRIGRIDPTSELYSAGIRPGDEISSYNGSTYHGYKDIFQAAMLGDKEIRLKGYKINYIKDTRYPFDVSINTYQHPQSLEPGILTSGVLAPAAYLLYNPLKENTPNPILESSAMSESGIKYGDRILWVDGELIFSQEQLNNIINSPQTLLTVHRNGKTILFRVPRVQLNQLRFTDSQKNELKDWQFEAKIQASSNDLYMIPYFFLSDGTVEEPIRFFENSSFHFESPSPRASTLARTLLPGDHIIAVDGQPTSRGFNILTALQTHKIHIITQSGNENLPIIPWKSANTEFDTFIDWENLEAIANSIGTPSLKEQQGKMHLLKPITPLPMDKIAEGHEGYAAYLANLEEQEKSIEVIKDPEKKALAYKNFKMNKNRLWLGINLQDRIVNYNPLPHMMFYQVAKDIWSTLSALFTGQLNPKWLSGPIGIVQIMHHGWSLGVKEAFFWLAVISLNLGILNLLPIPVLDGGHICFSLWEMITRKRLKAKIMERMVIPFVVLLIGFFVFVTYHDVLRLFKSIF